MLKNFGSRRLIFSMSNDDVKVIFNRLEDILPALDLIIRQIEAEQPCLSDAELEAKLGYSAQEYIDHVVATTSDDRAAAIRQQEEAKQLQRQNPDIGLFLEEFEKIHAKLTKITEGTA
jgi:hypothetical protein